LFTLLYIVICYVLELLIGKLSGQAETMSAMMSALLSADPEAYLDSIPAPSVSGIGYVLITALGVMGMILSAGYSLFALNVARRREASYGNLFDTFGMFFKILWLNVLMGIFITLWTMLFFFPGIVAAYRYSMAIYVRLENPDMSTLDCIRTSKDITRGHKWELFVLDLSFIGWSLLTVIPLVLLWVQPYMELTKAHYYCALCGDIYSDGYNVGGGYDSEDFRARAQDVPWEDADD
jgi:uncharacterized membrane protein